MNHLDQLHQLNYLNDNDIAYPRDEIDQDLSSST